MCYYAGPGVAKLHFTFDTFEQLCRLGQQMSLVISVYISWLCYHSLTVNLCYSNAPKAKEKYERDESVIIFSSLLVQC